MLATLGEEPLLLITVCLWVALHHRRRHRNGESFPATPTEPRRPTQDEVQDSGGARVVGLQAAFHWAPAYPSPDMAAEVGIQRPAVPAVVSSQPTVLWPGQTVQPVQKS
eukprot:3423783-Rhodomonas_salina.3